MDTKFQRLQEALAAQRSYMQRAKNGAGVDRIMLGLRMMAAEEGMEMPGIFTDPFFNRSCTWELSTSNAGTESTDRFGYGPVVNTGYGLGYLIHGNDVRVTVTGYEDCEEKDIDVHAFGDHFKSALRELHEVATWGQQHAARA